MDAYAYALLAHGELDLVVEAGLSHHDYAALVPVVEGAGGVVTNWSGAPVGSDARGETLAAATPALHAAALKVLAG
jgi:histidinol-phosphatase